MQQLARGGARAARARRRTSPRRDHEPVDRPPDGDTGAGTTDSSDPVHPADAGVQAVGADDTVDWGAIDEILGVSSETEPGGSP